MTNAEAYDALAKEALPWAPAGFPLVAPGLFVGYCGSFIFMFAGKGYTAESSDAYLMAYSNALDKLAGCSDNLKICSYIQSRDDVWWTSLSLSERVRRLAQFGAVSRRHERTLTTHVSVAVTYLHSLPARAVARTLGHFSRQHYPQQTVGTSRDAWRVLSRHASSERITLLRAACQHIVQTYVPDLDP